MTAARYPTQATGRSGGPQASLDRPDHAPDPRGSNHGGHTPTPPPVPAPSETRLGSRFDWYETTHDGLDDGSVAQSLALALGGRIVRSKGRNGYSRALAVQVEEDVLATVYGGSLREGEVHITITGASCDVVVPIVRRLWPDHRVSRADSALDFAADFDALDVLVLGFATRLGLKHGLITNSDGGATRYVGSRQSEVQVRVYKKSEQLIALHPDRAADVVPGIVRAECVVRPSKRHAKDAVSVLGPDDVWGLGAWSTLFALEVLTFDAVRTSTHFRRPSDWDRSLHWLGVQYGPSVHERAGDVGWDQAVAEVLGALRLLGEES